MRIGYIAKHDSGGNDDEGAITHALCALGHDVQRLREYKGHKAETIDCDFYLFHHWSDFRTLGQLTRPKVFWYFDLVYTPDTSLAVRCQHRINWMRDVMPLADLGFCTDGDWVEQTPGPLRLLRQGADERVMGRGAEVEEERGILLTGIKNGGKLRSSFVNEMTERWKEQFTHIERGVYRRDLADLIARHKIVVAPDGPITDLYWSNRVYNVLGFGGFLLHPWCAGLANEYKDGEEIVYYRSRDDLHDKIAYYLDRPNERRAISSNGLCRTLREHTYRHRCERLIQVVKERPL